MDGTHRCLGCRKEFGTLKGLYIHQPKCNTHKELKSKLIQPQKQLRRTLDNANMDDRPHPKQQQLTSRLGGPSLDHDLQDDFVCN
jgi:hypothetical protein